MSFLRRVSTSRIVEPRRIALARGSRPFASKSKKPSAPATKDNILEREMEHDQDYGELVLSPAASALPAARADLGSSWHIPVLLEETLSYLAPIAQRENSFIIDATFGGGGHSLTLLERFPKCRILGLDRDSDAFSKASNLQKRKKFEDSGRLKVVHTPFSRLQTVLESEGITLGSVCAILADLGVSSLHLDEGRRGFSFKAENNAPLDMRMDQSNPNLETAAQLISRISEQELSDIIWRYGEDRFSRRIAHGIVEARKEKPITHTLQLAEIVSKVRPEFRGSSSRFPGRSSHPATKTFQALRIAINDELKELSSLLHFSERALAPGGRLVSIAFHALEDGMIKNFLRPRTNAHSSKSPTFRDVTKNPITPTLKEIEVNVRARSAKLRCAERTLNPAWSLSKSGDEL